MNIFHVLMIVLIVLIGWLGLVVYGPSSHRGMLKMFKKVAFEIGGGILLGLIICTGPILDALVRH